MKRYLLTLAILALTAAINLGYSRPETRLARDPLGSFPATLGNWQAVREHMIDDSSMAVLLVDDYIFRTYVNDRGETIDLYIGYFESQREGKQVHSPRQCLTGAGWNILELKEYPLPGIDGLQSKAIINYQLVGDQGRRQLYLWWYQGRGRVYANEYLNKFYLVWDALTKGRTDGALLRVNMAVSDDVNETLKKEESFIRSIMPLLARFIPK